MHYYKFVLSRKKDPGTDVTVADYNHSFHFTQAPYEYAPKLLCWKPKNMKEFEDNAKRFVPLDLT